MLDEKATLKRYLQAQRDALRWKLDGLGERDARWPMTPTGTNLLGLVKHVASMEYDYFGLVFDRPSPEPMPWLADDAETNADLWATLDQPIEWVIAFYGRATAHADATIDALALDDTGSVPWWPEDGRQVTLHQIMVHMIAESARHAGHADILRETVDGAAGLRPGVSNLPDQDAEQWAGYVEKLKRVADDAGRRG